MLRERALKRSIRLISAVICRSREVAGKRTTRYAPVLRNTMEIRAVTRFPAFYSSPFSLGSAVRSYITLARPPNPQTRIISSRAIMAVEDLCVFAAASTAGIAHRVTPPRGILPPLPFLIIYGSASFSSPYRLLVIRCTLLKDSPARKRQIAFAPRSCAPSRLYHYFQLEENSERDANVVSRNKR